MGVESALRAWKPLLRPSGRLALSEAVWLSSNPLDEALGSDYPAMADVRHWRAVVRANGYELLGDFVLPDAAWWEYHTPMQERLRVLAPKYAGDAEAEAILKDRVDEIAAYRDHGMHFGYVVLVMGLSD